MPPTLIITITNTILKIIHTEMKHPLPLWLIKCRRADRECFLQAVRNNILREHQRPVLRNVKMEIEWRCARKLKKEVQAIAPANHAWALADGNARL